VGGMTIGTLFTLFVVPSLYVLIAQDHGHAADRDREADSGRVRSESGHDLGGHTEPEYQGTG
jgi:multidrug efflux pump